MSCKCVLFKELKFFKLEEFLESETALKNKIENLPSFQVIENIYRLAEVLDGLRDAWGLPVHVNSGFRSPKLNSAVGGVSGSAHLFGNAADLVSGYARDFFEFTVAYFKENKIPFDQIILEKSGSSTWVHIGLYSNDGKQRGEVKELQK